MKMNKPIGRLTPASLFGLAVFSLAASILLPAPSALADDYDGNSAKGVTNDLLLDAQNRPDVWVHYARNYEGWRYFPGDKINRENVHRLVPKWAHQTGVFGGGFEVSAVLFDNKMYVTTANSHLICLDPRTGDQLWRYDHLMPEGVSLCCGPVNRGVAAFGNRVYWVSLDAVLHCFDAETGLKLWERRVGDFRESYSLTLAPLIIKDKVIVGIAGAEYGVRGFIDAYDARTGELEWRFWTIPEPGEPGSETWGGDSWMNGGGSAWVTGTYDPELNLLYWGIGNPSPDFNGDVRPGDNLYTNCIIALNPDNGELQWYFQASPHDIFDWDGVSEPILVDETINGKEVKALVQANRNGYLYALDRTNGEFLYASPYSVVNWAIMDEQGKPRLNPEIAAQDEKHVCPGIFGGKNWQPAAYSPRTHMIYIPDMERCTSYTSMDITFRKGLPYYGGMIGMDPPEMHAGSIKAMDVRTGELVWSHELDDPNWAGMLATGGGLVFGGTPDGFLRAFNDETGEMLWEFQTGSGIFAPPTTYEIDGKQYIGLASGWGQPAEVIGVAATQGGSTYYMFGLMED